MTTPTLEKPATGQPPRGDDRRVGAGLLDPAQLRQALPVALVKLDPRTLWHNPVMLIVEAGAAFTTVLAIAGPSVLASASATVQSTPRRSDSARNQTCV